MTPKTKICTKCKKELPATTEYFYYAKKSKDGLRSWCKDCWKDYKREHRRQIAENSRNYYKKMDKENHKFLNKIHYKIIKLKPKQDYCSICNQEKKLELSSIDGKYSEDVNDYCWLCRECHQLYDRINKTHKR